jgi:hypothetical protein
MVFSNDWPAADRSADLVGLSRNASPEGKLDGNDLNPLSKPKKSVELDFVLLKSLKVVPSR